MNRRSGGMRLIGLCALAAAILVGILLPMPALRGNRASPVAAADEEGGVRVTRVDLPANDLIYDPFSHMLYASIPSGVSGLGNTVTAINPDTGAIGPSTHVGDDPGLLALSDDGRYLYVGTERGTTVARIDLRSRAIDLRFSVGVDPRDGPLYAADLDVLPGEPGSVAIARRALRYTSGNEGGVAVYDDGVQRPRTAPEGGAVHAVTFAGSPSQLYGCSGYSDRTLWVLSVEGDGVSVRDVTGGLASQRAPAIFTFDDGLLYSGPFVVNPDTRGLVGFFDARSGTPALDPRRRRVLFAGGDGGSPPTAAVLRVFDQDTFLPVASFHIPQVAYRVARLVRMGADGVAIRTTSDSGRTPLGQLLLVHGFPDRLPDDAVGPARPTPTPVPAGLDKRPPLYAGAAEVRLMDLPANDLIYAPGSHTLYASVPGHVGPGGNSVRAIDPHTGTVGPAVFVGSNPNKLALSDDGRYLYVGLDGAAAVAQLDLASRAPVRQFPLRTERHFPPSNAADMLVLPGNSDVVAASLRSVGVFPQAVGLVIYDGGVPRPEVIPWHTGGWMAITFSESESVLYGCAWTSPDGPIYATLMASNL